MQVVDVERLDGKWLITATGKAFGACPSCSVLSTMRHGRYSRQLQDLLEQGTVGHCHINRKRSRLNEARGLKVDHTAFRAYVSSRLEDQGTHHPIAVCRQQMASWSKVAVDEGVSRQEALCLSR
jgi:hypothetical protein